MKFPDRNKVLCELSRGILEMAKLINHRFRKTIVAANKREFNIIVGTLCSHSERFEVKNNKFKGRSVKGAAS